MENKLKQKFQSNDLLIGSWITIGDTSVAEIMAKAGFDWLSIDMEHSAICISKCQELIRVIDLCGVAPLVRVGANDSLLIKRVMDAGAHGVIVPMVNSKSDAEKAVSAVKYPPHGTRGVGLSRAQGYNIFLDDYKQWVEKESIVVVQIEHIKAVENLEEIISVQGVDAFIVGPYDLSGSLGVPGDFENKKMKDALTEIQSIISKKNIPAGYHVVSTSPGLVERKIEEGYKFIAYGVDFVFLNVSCGQGLKNIRSSGIYKKQK